MANRLTRVNEKIDAKLKELGQDRDERRRAVQLVAKRESRLEDLSEELGAARRRVRCRRRAVEEVRTDLEQLRTEMPDGEESALEERLDELAGELDEAVRIRDRLLDRIDRVTARLANAEDRLTEAIGDLAEDREALGRLRAKRRRINERRDRPSPNFAFAEFDCNDGTPLPKQSEVAVKDWCQRIGEKVRARFGAVHINSAYRHAAYNARIGGASLSIHIYDYPGRDHKAVAVDFSCEKGTPAEWFAFTAGLADGRGRYATFHHADTRNRIGWPDASW